MLIFSENLLKKISFFSQRLEKKDGNTKIVMAFESFDANRACFTIEGIKKYDASSLEKSEISLYDSVDPGKIP